MAVSICSLLTLTMWLACAAQAQGVNPFTTAPPPMKLVSSNERAQLSLAHDVKARTRAALDLAELRLKRAEELTTALSYDAASSELGCYQGIVEDAMNYLDNLKVDKSKMRDLFKRVELTLRAHGTRLEAIRRVTPTEYSINIKPIAESARNARTEALNAFYGDTVVREELKREEVKRDEKSVAGETVKAFTGGSPQQ
ncbi:MAG: hypothetical protein QOF02_3043 [Blastocatellia bacterium]|jgi:hypothetical protein|nr:hypothetical protein [Blastocatellia bacterium]